MTKRKIITPKGLVTEISTYQRNANSREKEWKTWKTIHRKREWLKK